MSLARRAGRWWALGLWACWAFSPALAQDLPDATPPLAPADTFSLDVSASAELRSGNVSLVNLSDQLLARYARGAHELSLRTSHAFGKQGGERFMNAVRGLYLQRYGFELGLWGLSRLGPVAIVHFDRDEFRRREYLFNAGAGLFVEPVRSATLRWDLTLGYVYELERFAVLTDPLDPSRKVPDSGYRIDAQRAWLATELGWQFWERFHLGEDLVVQVPLDHCACDTRVYTTTYLRIYGNDYVALQTAASVIYDAGPPRFGGVKAFDLILRSSLVFSL